MMKRMLILCCFLSVLSACNKTEQSNKIELTNNYLLFSSADYIPHSNIIKQQKIIGSEHQRYQSDSNGMLTSVELIPVKIDNNYELNKSHFLIDNKYNLDLTMEFDEKKRLVKMEDVDKKISWIATYDDQNRIIKIERFTTPITINQIFYDNDKITKIITQTTLEMDDSFSYNLTEEKYFSYNENKQLSKTTIKIHDQLDSKSVQTKKCSFYDHNENGDWTKSYCLKLGENYTYFNLREITY